MKKKRNPLTTILLLFAGLIVGGCLGWATVLMIGMFFSEPIAHSMMPPPYPNSRIVNEYKSGGPDREWAVYTYETADKIEDVLKYMENYLPGFALTQSENKLIVYSNARSDTGILARVVSVVMTAGDSKNNVPSVWITISKDQNTAQITRIVIRIDWPSL